MMKKHTTTVRILLVLAMLGSLVAITAAPASANVTAATVTPAPATAGGTASYTVAFNVGAAGALTAATHTISITFPSGTTLPTSIDKLQVTVNGTVLASDPTVSGQTVSLITPVTVANSAAVSVVISQVAGITNPAVAYTAASAAYKVSVYTSVESTTVNSNAFEILPSYSISPTSGDRFDSVTVTGKGWTASGGITIGGGLTGTGTADASGAFTLTASPNGNGGAVTITDGAGQTQASPWVGTVTQPSYTLKARVVVSPTSGLVGSTVVVLGYDFTSGGTIPANSITMGGTSLTHSQYMLTTRDAYGTLDDVYVSVTVPATMTGGAKTVAMTDGTKTATATFTVRTPTITLDPTSGAPNTLVTITGTNFGAAQTIAVGGLTFAGSAWNTAVITTDASGRWTYSMTVPAAALSGSNPVVATSTAGTTASTTFTVSARTLTLTPSSGPVGTEVLMGGSNMTANGTIAVGGVTFAGAAWNTAVILIDSLGNIFPTTLTVPAATTGPKTVTATDSGGLTAVATFTMTAAIGDQLASIANQLIRVWGYSAGVWQMYDPADLIGSDLASLIVGRGYWIKVTEDCTLLYAGNSWFLVVGWNLMGWSVSTQALSNIESDMATHSPGLPSRFHGAVQLDGADVPDGIVVTATIEGDTYTATTPSVYGDSTYMVEIAPPEGTTYTEGATITFTIDGRAADQTWTWEAGDNMELNLITLSVIPGDANGDGVVNAIDITKTERIIAGLDAPTAGADANQDGSINALDITETERIIAGLGEIKVGVIGPMAYTQGQHEWYGALLAAEEINAQGGVMIGGNPYSITLVQADSNEIVSPTDAVTAMEKLITVDQVDFVVGGLSSESVLAMQDVAMDYQTIFLGAGASFLELCQRVATDYDKYKYWFRVSPVNGTYLTRISFMLTGMVAGEIGALTYPDVPKIAILAENVGWADLLVANAEAYFAAPPPNGLGLEVVGTWRPSQMATDVTAELTAIEAAGANIIYTAVTGTLGVTYTSQWGELQIPAASVGINLEAQKGDFLDVTGGYGAYETTLNTYARVAITDETIPFYDTFLARFGEIPLYTAGTYDAIYVLKEAIESAGTLDSDGVVTELEGTDYIGTFGRLVFMGTDTETPHDVTWGPGYVTGVGVQWQDGELKGVWPDAGGVLAPVFYDGTVDYILPPWVVEALQQ